MLKFLRVAFLIFLFLFFLSNLSQAQLNWKVSKDSLVNGLTVLMLEDHTAPVISYQVWYQVGSKNEVPGITGISHMHEHVMLPESDSRLIMANGGIDNAYTNFDNTVSYENLPSDKLELAVRLESERQKNLVITEEKIASEKQVIAEERRVRIDNNPNSAMTEALLNLAYTAHPYHWHIIGYMQDILNFNAEKVKEYRKLYYTPNNALVVVAGDIDPKKTMELIHKYYDDVPKGPIPPKVDEPEPPQIGERIAYLHKIAQLPAIVMGYHTPDFNHPDLYPLQVAARILFFGESSRLYHKMVYQDQSALYVGGDCFTLEDPGLFYIVAMMTPGHTVDEGKKTILDEIEKMKTELVTPQELQKAKNQLESEYIFGLQSADQKGSSLAYYQSLAGDYEAMFEVPQKFQAVTAEDVQSVVKKYLIDRNRNTVILVPEMPSQSQP
jgi:zinc protease